MEQFLPLSAPSIIPDKKVRVLRWVTFFMFLFCVWGYDIIEYFWSLIDPEVYMMYPNLLARLSRLDEVINPIIFTFLWYISSNGAVRKAMLITIVLSVFSCVFNDSLIECSVESYGVIFFMVYNFAFVYAFSILLSNTELSKEKKGWITFLFVKYLFYPFSELVEELYMSSFVINDLSFLSHYDDFYECIFWCAPMYGVIRFILSVFECIAWYQLVFSDAFFGYKKDEDNTVYKYKVFNRYTMGWIICPVVVVSLTFMSILVFTSF